MNAMNNISEISPEESSSSRPISVLQLATALAFVALPATVLFPIIARPAPAIQPVIVSPYSSVLSAKPPRSGAWSETRFTAQVRARTHAAVVELKRLAHQH
jgi:hypothetical protein